MVAESVTVEPDTRRCTWWFQGADRSAQGFASFAVFRAGIIVSNLFLLSSFLHLANQEAGCLDEQGEIIDKCEGRVYGQKPGSLIANIAVISGILGALLMPLVGALLDYTEYRWITGVVSSIIIVLVQAIQIGTVSSTWFYMTILQAINGFLYSVVILVSYAYMPDMARHVGEVKMAQYQGNFSTIQFGCQVVFLIFAVGLSFLLKLNGGGQDDVRLAQITQGMDVLWSIPSGILAWRLFPHVPASRSLPQHQRLWSAGFQKNWETVKLLNRHYRKSLFLYLISVIFAEASAQAFTAVSVIYLDETIGLSSSQIGIFFLLALIAFVPGTQLAPRMASRLNPKNSLRVNLTLLAVATIVGAMILGKGTVMGAYVWGCVVGLLLGWFYPTEALMFSLCLPKGQDSELAGFFVYSSQILVWLPPLIFSALVNSGIDQNWGVVAVAVFGLIAVAVLSLMPSWSQILADVSKLDVEPNVEEQTDIKEGDVEQ